MDFYPQRSLNFLMNRLGSVWSMSTKIFFLYQISIGLRFLKDHEVVHLDIKPENLLVKCLTVNKKNQYIVKIIDFGEAYY